MSSRTLRERSLYGSRVRCIPLQFLTFTLHLYLSSSLSFPSFLCRQKGAKSSAHGKNLHKRPLLRPHNVSLRSVVCSSLQAFGCFQGAAKLVPHGCIRKITAMLHSNILTQWPENNRPCVGFFNGAVLGILPLLMETAKHVMSNLA